MTGKTNPLKDFDAPALLKTTEDHEERLKSLSNRIKTLEERIGDSEAFGKTFATAQLTEKTIDNAITDIIDKHDNHKIKISVMAISKWLAVALASAFIGAWIQRTMTPAFNPQELVDALKTHSNSSNY